MKQKAYFGTSTWTYPGWEGIVYRDVSAYRGQFKAECLSEYVTSELFDCVGIDSTFYGPPSEKFLQKLKRQLPGDFPCVFKIPREITSPRYTSSFGPKGKAGDWNPHFMNPHLLRDDMLTFCRKHLPQNEGLFVLQFPSLPKAVTGNGLWLERLDYLLGDLEGNWPLAIEIRNPDLLTVDYFEVLKAHEASHMFQVWTGMPLPHEVLQQFPQSIDCSSRVGLRALVAPGLTYSAAVEKFSPYSKLVSPNEDIRKSILALVETAGELEKMVITTVNNRLEGCAPLTVQALRKELERRK